MILAEWQSWKLHRDPAEHFNWKESKKIPTIDVQSGRALYSLVHKLWRIKIVIFQCLKWIFVPTVSLAKNQGRILSVIDCWEHLKAAGCTQRSIKVYQTKWFFVSQLQKHTTRVGSGTNSKQKSSVCSNGFSKRIFEESFASITPYLRQASMKRAVRSNCLILFPRQTWGESNRDKEVSGVCTKPCQSPPYWWPFNSAHNYHFDVACTIWALKTPVNKGT